MKPITPEEAEKYQEVFEKEKIDFDKRIVVDYINNALRVGKRKVILYGHHINLAGSCLRKRPELIQYVIESFGRYWVVHFETEILSSFAGYYTNIPQYTFTFTPLDKQSEVE